MKVEEEWEFVGRIRVESAEHSMSHRIIVDGFNPNGNGMSYRFANYELNVYGDFLYHSSGYEFETADEAVIAGRNAMCEHVKDKVKLTLKPWNVVGNV